MGKRVAWRRLCKFWKLPEVCGWFYITSKRGVETCGSLLIHAELWLCSAMGLLLADSVPSCRGEFHFRHLVLGNLLQLGTRTFTSQHVAGMNSQPKPPQRSGEARSVNSLISSSMLCQKWCARGSSHESTELLLSRLPSLCSKAEKCWRGCSRWKEARAWSMDSLVSFCWSLSF